MKMITFTVALLIVSVLSITKNFAMEMEKDKNFEKEKDPRLSIFTNDYKMTKNIINNEKNIDVNFVYKDGFSLLNLAIFCSFPIQNDVNDVIDVLVALLSRGANIEHLIEDQAMVGNIFHLITFYYPDDIEKYTKLTQALIEYSLSDKTLTSYEGPVVALTQRKKLLIKMIYETESRMHTENGILPDKTAYDQAPPQLKEIFDNNLKTD